MKQRVDDESNEQPTTKEIILSEALALFAEKGYEGTTVQDIAKAVGIKAASLYAHYSGKDGIFRAVFAQAADSWAKVMEASFAEARKAASLEDGITAVIARYVNHAAGANTYRFWARLYVFPPQVMRKMDFQLIAEFDARFEESLAGFCSAMGGADAQGRHPTVLLQALTRLSWGFVLCDSQGDLEKLDTEIRGSVRLLLRGFLS